MFAACSGSSPAQPVATRSSSRSLISSSPTLCSSTSGNLKKNAPGAQIRRTQNDPRELRVECLEEQYQVSCELLPVMVSHLRPFLAAL